VSKGRKGKEKAEEKRGGGGKKGETKGVTRPSVALSLPSSVVASAGGKKFEGKEEEKGKGGGRGEKRAHYLYPI